MGGIGAARSKKAYDGGGDRATAIREVVHKAAERKKRADDGEDGEVAVRRSTRQSRSVLVNYVLSTNE